MSADISLFTTKVVEIRPIDTLIRRVNEDGSIRIVSDVTLLFNEDRIINDLGEDNFRNLVRSMQDNPASPYRDSGLTDDQMIETIKSRYLQTPSEVRAWLEKLVDKAEIVKSDYESLIEEYEAEMAAKVAAKAASDVGDQSSKSE
jgi:hypothetical protein|nr:MAG TPA: hypothetical protein [Microviridae sp.]